MKKLQAKLNYPYDTWKTPNDIKRYMQVKRKTVKVINRNVKIERIELPLYDPKS